MYVHTPTILCNWITKGRGEAENRLRACERFTREMRRNKCREKRVEKRLTKGGKKRAQVKEEGVRTAWKDV